MDNIKDTIKGELEPKKGYFMVTEKEDENLILTINGYSVRVPYKTNVEQLPIGQYIEVEYIGDLKDIFNLKPNIIKNIKVK